MTRRPCTACEAGGPCVCEQVEALRYSPNDRAVRVTVQQQIGQLADQELRSVDPPFRPVSNAECGLALQICVGDAGLAYRDGDEADVEAALLLLAAETLLQLEAIERARAL